MKTFTVLVLAALLSTAIHGQNEVVFGLGVRWGVAVYKPGDGLQGFPKDTPVDAVIMYKDAMGTVIYTEEHSGALADFSHLHFTIGQGNNPVPAEGLPASGYRDVAKLCYKVTVHTENGEIVVEDMLDVSSVPKANFAYHALNSERLGDNSWNDQTLRVNEFLDHTGPKGLLNWLPGESSEYNTISGFDLTDFIHNEESISPVSQQTINVLRIGTGDPGPLVFGSATPPEIENYITICAPSLHDTRHALGIKVAPQEAHSPSIMHNTAAIYADNTESPMSAGVLANAQTWGFYGTAQNGVVGISTGAGNGAGIWGGLGQAPAAGGFKYALFGNSQSFTGSWGAAIFGNGFYTGTWSMSSDARLKSEVRAQSDALDRIMQLRPSQYRYRQDTPYSLPEGIHHGFLAQEMEEVFPELVSDVSMPLSTDPDEMYTSGSTQYKAINYIEMIAILTSAVQELNTTLNAKIDAQAAEIAELRSALETALGQKN